MGRDAATRMVEKAERRERAKSLAALRKWLPMRRAQLALSPVAAGSVTDADTIEAVLSSWVTLEITEAAAEVAEDSAS